MKDICIIHRDKRTGGTSVEEIFNGLIGFWSLSEFMTEYFYNSSLSALANAREIQRMNPRLCHITAGVYFLSLFLINRKIVLTIHDVGRYKELKGIRRFIYKMWYLTIPIRISHKITTVSKYTKNDIEQYFGRKAGEKTVVIPNPKPDLFKFYNKLFNSDTPRVLHVGTAEHKNLSTVVRAIEKLKCRLVIIGKLSEMQTAELHERKIDYENHWNLAYHEVYQQYCLADIVVFVSLHEGFGMPILEAQATGRPIIVSRLCSLMEVGKDGVYYVSDPRDPTEIRNAIVRLTQDSGLRNSLVELGKKNVKRFEMRAIAKQYEVVYSGLLN